MKVKHLERLAIDVPNLDEAIKTFSELLGIEFEATAEPTLPGGNKIKCAFSSKGVELVENPGTDMAVRSFHFRVDNLEEAKAWVESKGGKILGQFSVGKMDELSTNVMGLRMIFLTYPGDDVIKAIKS